jgi:hypothetical protein
MSGGDDMNDTPAVFGVDEQDPTTELGAFGSVGAVATGWPETRDGLRDAQVYWLSTVRPDGRPHVTPLLAVWSDDALFFCTGADERKAANLVGNAHCVLTTGRNTLDDGLDIVMEGTAVQVVEPAELRGVADVFESKYGAQLTASEGTWSGLGDTIREGAALVYRVAPTRGFAFGKGARFSQTRYTFRPGPGPADPVIGPSVWRVVVVGRAPEKMEAAIAVLVAEGFAATGVFSEDEAVHAIAAEPDLFAVVAGGFLDEPARERLRAVATEKGALLITTSIGHDDPAAHFTEHVVPQLVAARTRSLHNVGT